MLPRTPRFGAVSQGFRSRELARTIAHAFHSIKKGAEREWVFCAWSFDAVQLQIAKHGMRKESGGSLGRGGW